MKNLSDRKVILSASAWQHRLQEYVSDNIVMMT